MKKTTTLLVSAFAVTMLAGCSKAPNVDEIAKGFKSDLEGKISFNYETKYKVDIKNGNASTESFKHDITETTKAEIDLTAGDLYLHIKKNATDYDKTSLKEALVYKDGADYYYLTNFHKDPLKLADEPAAKDKIADLIAKTSFTFVGGVTLDSLTYETKGVYENIEFLGGLGDENYGVEDIKKASSFKKYNEGFETKAKLDYMAYKTDMAMSRFAGEEGSDTPCLDLSIKVNKDGFVDSYDAKMAARNVMSLGDIKPTTLVDGTRKLTAKYNDTFEKLSTIAHEETKGNLAVGNANNKGTLTVYVAESMAAAAQGQLRLVKGETNEVIVGHKLFVQQTPAGENKLLALTYNGNSLDKPNLTVPGLGDFYVFDIEEGNTKINANYSGADTTEIEYSTVTKAAEVEGVTLTYYTTTMANIADPSKYVELTDKGVAVGDWFVVKVEGSDKAIKVNGQATHKTANYYAFNNKAKGTLVVTLE